MAHASPFRFSLQILPSNHWLQSTQSKPLVHLPHVGGFGQQAWLWSGTRLRADFPQQIAQRPPWSLSLRWYSSSVIL